MALAFESGLLYYGVSWYTSVEAIRMRRNRVTFYAIKAWVGLRTSPWKEKRGPCRAICHFCEAACSSEVACTKHGSFAPEKTPDKLRAPRQISPEPATVNDFIFMGWISREFWKGVKISNVSQTKRKENDLYFLPRGDIFSKPILFAIFYRIAKLAEIKYVAFKCRGHTVHRRPKRHTLIISKKSVSYAPTH